MKSRREGFRLLALIVAALITGVMLAAMAQAAGDTPQVKNLSLQAGESYVVDGLKPNETPAIKVLNNPHALVVHSEDPGKLVLLGAEEGHWAIEAKLADGSPVTIDVTVHALRDAAAPLKPGVAPPAMSDGPSIASSAAPAPAAAPSSVPIDSETASAPGAGKTAATAASPKTAAMAPSAPPSTSPAPLTSSASPVSSALPSNATMPSQTAGGSFRNNPSILASGGTYSTEDVARSGGTHYLPADGISLMTGTSQVIDFPQPMRRVSVADTNIADVQVINPFQLNLIGHKPGFTTLAVWSRLGHYEERQVRIDPSGKQQVMLHCMVAQLNRNKIENQGTNLASAFPGLGLSMVGLPGAVATPYNPQVTTGGNAILPNGTTIPLGGANMPPGGVLDPLLYSTNMTYGLAAQNSQMQWQGFFQYLETHNPGKILAQPNLLANSGEKAKFLSGGEIPIVISQALNSTIVFKQYGTSVVFVPTVVGVNQIELLVEPEVSQPDFTLGVQMFGFNVPAFVTRRAETMVRLNDNQTLIIAGLILHDKHETIQKVPYLGDIPFAGGLFRNTNWVDDETDLVMSVTPQIVRPLPTGGQAFQPSSAPWLRTEEIATHRTSEPDAGRPRF